MNRHLAIFSADTIDHILSGAKTVESRLSVFKIAPFAQIGKGDVVLMKQSGGEMRGQFLVDRVIFFDHPSSQDVDLIKDRYSKELMVDKVYWQARQQARYLSLIFVKHPSAFVTAPIIVPKRDRRGWVVLDNKKIKS